MLAYILVSLKRSVEQDLLDDLLGNDEVQEAHILFGEWDLLLKLEGETAEDIGTFVMDHVRNNPDVNLSSTLIVAK